MELKDALLARKSVRRFTDEPVSAEMADELMHAGQYPLNIIYVGHPAETPEPRDRYSTDRVHFIE